MLRISSVTGRNLLLICSITLMAVTAMLLHGQLSLPAVAEHEATLRLWCNQNLLLSSLLCFLVYATATAISVPAAAGMTVVVGWVFGLPLGLLIISFASTTGACCAFLISRLLFRAQVRQRFREQLKEIEQALERHGASYLFLLRLVPLMPFFVINIIMGLTPMRLRTFWWVSQLGMFPGTIVYVAAGASVPTLQIIADQGLSSLLNLRLLLLFTLLGLMPIAVRAIFHKWSGRRNSGDVTAASG